MLVLSKGTAGEIFNTEYLAPGLSSSLQPKDTVNHFYRVKVWVMHILCLDLAQYTDAIE